jgi:type IV secretion system protein VirB4
VHYDLGRDPTNRVPQNPLVLLSDPKHLGWLAYFVEMLVSFRGHEVTAVERTDIDRALKATALLSKPNWRLSSVWASLSSQAVKVALAPWVGEGSLAHFFDNEEDRVDFEAVITAMETGQILLNEDVCGPFLEYLFYRIDNDMLERKEAGIEGPMMIYLPELWALLKNRLFAAKLDDWLRTMAKRMVLLMMDTQDPDGLAKSDVWPVLRDNIATSIYTPNRRAAGAELKQLYITKFQLTEEQVDIIVRGRRMHDYLYVQQGLSRKFGLEVGATALAVLRSETAAQISFNRHEASGRSTWVEDYIAEMKGMRWATEEEIELA